MKKCSKSVNPIISFFQDKSLILTPSANKFYIPIRYGLNWDAWKGKAKESLFPIFHWNSGES